MVAFIKDAQFRSLSKKNGVKRIFKTSKARIESDLRGYVVLLDLLAKQIALSQGRKIVKKEHVELALKTLSGFSK